MVTSEKATESGIDTIPRVQLPDYTEVEQEFLDYFKRQAEQARMQREQSYPEWDGMFYQIYWESNAKAANGSIPPKQNREDVTLTTGITLEKKNTLLSNAMNYDYKIEIEGYDNEDKVVNEMGDIMADMVRKSREIESPNYETKAMHIRNELLTQGTVYVEDRWLEYSLPDKELEKMGLKLNEMQWVERMDKVYSYCDTHLHTGLDVYLGNIREENFQKQPFVITRKLMTVAEAQAIYGDWERWENVPWGRYELMDDGSDTRDFNNWQLETFKDGLIEELKYYNPWTNNFMIVLSGVLMFPVKRDKKGRLSTVPLSSLTGECKIPIACGISEPITNFAYGKSTPAKTKVDQQVFDEFMRMVVRKTRRSVDPPMGNMTGNTVTTTIYQAGTIHDDINPEKLMPIGTNDGVSQAEFNAIQFIKQIIDEKSVSPILEGQQSKGKQTARAAVQQKQQAMIKMGIIILGILNFEKQLAAIRINNILKYWTQPIDSRIDALKQGIESKTGGKQSEMVKKYRRVTVDAELDDGEKGKRIIEMVPNADALPHPDQIAAEEKLASEVSGEKVKIHYLNVEQLTRMQFTWHITVVPEEKNSGDLKALMFEETAVKMLQMFPETTNKEYIQRKMALNAKLDPDKLIIKPQGQGMQQQLQVPPGGEQQGEKPSAGVAGKMKEKAGKKPSINTMAGA